MLELKYIRNNRDKVTRGLDAKRVEVDLERLLELDEQRRSLLVEVEQLKAQRNQANQKIKQAGGGKPDQEGRPGVVRRKSGREDRRQG